MRWLGTKTVRLGSIRLPGDFKARLSHPHVAERAKSLKELGIINLPVIEWKSKELIAGGDRIASMMLNGYKGDSGVEVRAVDASPDEVKRLRIHENLHRRHDNKDALVAELVAWERGRSRSWGDDVPDGYTPDEPGNKVLPEAPPPATKKEAIKAVAAKLGTTPAAVKQADYRARKEKSAPAAEKAKPADSPVLETWGVEVTPEFVASAERAQAYIDELDGKLRCVIAAITKGQETLSPEQATRLELQALRMQIRGISARLRSLRPYALCHACKGVPQLTAGCAGCRGTGVAGEDAVKAAPEELRRKGDEAGVFVGPDVFKTLSELMP